MVVSTTVESMYVRGCDRLGAPNQTRHCYIAIVDGRAGVVGREAPPTPPAIIIIPSERNFLFIRREIGTPFKMAQAIDRPTDRPGPNAHKFTIFAKILMCELLATALYHYQVLRRQHMPRLGHHESRYGGGRGGTSYLSGFFFT